MFNNFRGSSDRTNKIYDTEKQSIQEPGLTKLKSRNGRKIALTLLCMTSPGRRLTQSRMMSLGNVFLLYHFD